MKPWRIETITLDEQEEVAGITAVIDAPYLPRLEHIVYGDRGEARVIRRERGDTELWVQLDVAELLTLFHAVYENVVDPALEIPGCSASLSMVVYRLMED